MRKNTDQNYSKYLHFLGSDIYAEDHEDSKKLKVEKRMPNRLQIIHEQSLLKYESYVLSCPLVLWCSCTLRALLPYTPRVICTLLPHVPHVLRALVGYIPRVVGTQLNTDTKFGLYAKALLSRTVVPEAYLESSQTSTMVQCCKSS